MLYADSVILYVDVQKSLKYRIQNQLRLPIKTKQVNIKPIFTLKDDDVHVLTCSTNTSKQVQENVFTCFTKAEK